MSFLRASMFSAYFFLLTAGMGIACLPVLAMPRRVTVRLSRLWARLVMGGYRVIVGTTWEVRGAEKLPQGPVLAASKHQAMFETVVLPLLVFEDAAVILKKELMVLPVYGWFAAKMRMIPVDRGAHARALRAMVTIARERLAEGRSILIFPEGTRVPPGGTLPYKPGVAALYRQLGVPCVPVALNSGLAWPRKGFLGYRKGHIVVEILDPIEPGLDRAAFMETLRARIEPATARLMATAPGQGPNQARTPPVGSSPPRAGAASENHQKTEA